MPTIRRYRSPIVAQHAAAYLRQSGIMAMVVGQIDPIPGIGGMSLMPSKSPLGSGHYAVIIDLAEQVDEARQLLDEFDRSPPEVEEGWEEEMVPDLSLLDPELAPPCPKCGQTLPMDAALEACPGCAAEVDVAALLADLYGPELIAEALPPPSRAEIAGEVVDAADLHCPVCRYPLRGLAREGHCPECGEWYDKRAMLDPP